jgi:hypothetical protein
VTSALSGLAATDPHLAHIKAFELPAQQEQLVITAPGIVELGGVLAKRYLAEK